jgi:hypothetical protein
MRCRLGLVLVLLLVGGPWTATAASGSWAGWSPPPWHPTIEERYEIRGSFAGGGEPGVYAGKDRVDNSIWLHAGVTRLDAELLWQSPAGTADLDLVLASPSGRLDCRAECMAALRAKTPPPGFYGDFEGAPGSPDAEGMVSLDATQVARDGCAEAPCRWRVSVHVDGAAVDVVFMLRVWVTYATAP